MDASLLDKILGAVTAVCVAVITYLLNKRSQANVQLVDVTVLEHPNRALFPVLDFKLLNKGNSVAFLKKMEFEVLETRIDLTPVLEYYLESDEEHNLLITIKNAGWGAALDVKLDNLIDPTLREGLNLEPRDYQWRGEVPAKGIVQLVYPRTAIKEGTNVTIIEPRGLSTYHDQEGNQFVEIVRYDPYPFEEYKLVINPDGYWVRYRDFAAGIEPSRRYSLLLEGREEGYTRGLNIAHKISPNEVERIQVVLAAEKSLHLKLIARIYYNRNAVIKSQPLEVFIYHPNHLWYYHYKHSPTAQLKQIQPTYWSNEDELHQAYREAEFEHYYGSSRFRISWPPTSTAIQKLSAETLNEIGWMVIEQGMDIEVGIQLAQEAVKREPEQAIYLDTLGWGYYRKGMYSEAVEWLGKATQFDPQDEIIRQHYEQAKARLAALEC